MKKPLLTKLLILLIIGVLTLLNCSHFSGAQTGTQVNGIISQDTTWTKANSPYLLTTPVAVNNGVTLTIEAGTTVEIYYYIQVDGTLVVNGAVTDPVFLEGGISNGAIEFTSSSAGWNEQTGSGCVIKNAVIHSSIVIDGSPKISGCNVTGDINQNQDIFINDGSPIISSNNITGTQIRIYGGFPVIWNNNFTGAANGAGGIGGGYGTPYISNNIISNVNLGILAGNGVIERNLIENASVALEIGNPVVRNNTIINNIVEDDVAISIHGSSTPTINENNIITNYSLKVVLSLGSQTFDINATNNWWGTNDTQTINQSIQDLKTNFNLGTVNFLPILTAPNPQATPDSNAAVPAPLSPKTPNSSTTPTSTITSTPIPTLTPSPLATLSPKQPNREENSQTWLYAIISAMAVVIAILIGFSVILVKKRTKKFST
ncbi:MAG TPA: hypothetical protein VMD05_07190 [Candidatus Nanoarchaeia archaeon]|nr:hypothetical protein [Candidatus Nanoarchaeia archaeon]